MKYKMKSGHKIILAYTLYGILLVVVLLYLCFPTETVGKYVIASVKNIDPRLNLEIQDIEPTMPFGVKLREAEFSLSETPAESLFVAEKLTIRPALLAFLKGDSGYEFNARAYGGALKGHLLFSKKEEAPVLSTEINIRDIRLGEYPYLSSFFGYNTTGTLEGIIHYRGHGGKADIKILDGNLTLQKPFFDLNTIAFDQLLIKLVLEQRNMEISYAQMTGKQIQGTLSGSITLNNDLLKSRLDLKGTLEMLPGLFDTAMRHMHTESLMQESLETPFTITGTIDNPRLKFI